MLNKTQNLSSRIPTRIPRKLTCDLSHVKLVVLPHVKLVVLPKGATKGVPVKSCVSPLAVQTLVE
jgi:hypothetical protein